jgi:hypothetical protein
LAPNLRGSRDDQLALYRRGRSEAISAHCGRNDDLRQRLSLIGI